MSPPVRVVLDTQVALDLWHFHDPRVAPLRDALERGEAIALTDDACRAEWQRVLRYPALRIDEARCLALERAYDAHTQRFERRARAHASPPLPRCADPDDQKFLELARDAEAALLLSRDAALLALARRCERDGHFRILAPEAFAV